MSIQDEDIVAEFEELAAAQGDEHALEDEPDADDEDLEEDEEDEED